MYDRSTQKFFDRYRINIGEDTLPVIVSGLDLYRLHRVIERKPKRLSVTSDMFNDSSVLQTENGDYLLLSPGALSVAGTETEQGIIIEEGEYSLSDQLVMKSTLCR